MSAAERLGFQADEITPRIAGQLGLPSDTRGVVILGATPLSPVEGQISAGDVIVSINGEPIRSMRDLERVAADLKPNDLVRLIVRTRDVGERIINYRVRR